jgi:protein phosphatase-4 regulatory subunit 3
LEVELLEIICDLETNIVREFAQENAFSIPLILKLLMKEDLDEYVCFCLSSSLKALLVIYLEVPTEFIVTFFSEHFPMLIEPFLEFVPGAQLSPQKIDLYYFLLEIFEICLAFHPAITKNIFMRSILMEKIISLINPTVPPRLFLGAIRFFKVCMCMKDDYFSSLLIKKGFLKALINVLEHEGNSSNMVTSSVLSVFERIRKESCLKTMLVALVEGYGSMFRESFRYLPIFSELLTEYDKMFETPNSSPTPNSESLTVSNA